MKIVFKNLESSELARDIASEQILEVLNKFPETNKHKVTLTLCMDNSSQKPGKDLFGAKIMMTGSKFSNLVLEKQAPSLYVAVGELRDVLLERLNRANDRERVRSRKKLRQLKLVKGENL